MSKMYISNKDESARLFNNNLLEALSKVHWTVPLYVFIPVISYCLYYSIFEFTLSFISIIIYFIAGLVVWSFTEYALHRFVFHYQPSSDFGRRLHFLFHGVHHDYPKDSKRLVMPPGISIPLALLFYFVFYYLLGNILVMPFFGGFITGYLFYDITHYAIHHFNMKSKFWLKIKNHHMLHHYKYDDKGFGVSQPAWDYIFNTDFSEKNN